MKLHVDKCHIQLNRQEQNVLKIGNFDFTNSYPEKERGVKFDCKLKISTHIEDTFSKISRKLAAIPNMIPYMGLFMAH